MRIGVDLGGTKTEVIALDARGARIVVYDPVAMPECRRLYGEREDLKLFKTSPDALEGADALAIVTEWQEFRSPDFKSMKKLLKQPVIFDGRNLYDPGFVKLEGFRYFAICRGDRVGENT